MFLLALDLATKPPMPTLCYVSLEARNYLLPDGSEGGSEHPGK